MSPKTVAHAGIKLSSALYHWQPIRWQFTHPLVTSGPLKMGLRSIIPEPSAREHMQGLPESTLQGIDLVEGQMLLGVLKHPDTAKFCK